MLHYGWDHDFIFAYESMWSWLQKFMQWNYCSTIQAWQHFNRTKCSYPAGSKTVLNTVFLDFDKLSKSLDLTIEQIKQSQAQYYLFRNELAELCHDALRYCPMCLQEGFHSVIQQFLFIEECPHHNMPLMATCLNCLEPISIRVGSQQHARPYACPVCSFQFNSHEKPRYIPSLQRDRSYAAISNWLRKRHEYPISHRKYIKKWIGEGASRGRKRSRLRLLPFIWSEMIQECAPFAIFPPKSRYIKKTYTYQIDRLSKKSKNQTINYYLNALRILGEHLNMHDKCILEQTRQWWPDIFRMEVLEEELCPVAQAYVMWRMSCESLNRPEAIRHKYERYGEIRQTVLEEDYREEPFLKGTEDRDVSVDAYLSLYHECLVLSRYWRRKGVKKYDIRHITGRHLPFWYMDESEPGKKKIICWIERAVDI